MLSFYNSLTRRNEPFAPAEGRLVKLYTCGPTVHDYAHIGNFRAYVWEDLLRRHLAWRGYDVVHVMNITDVEDKIIRKANEADIEIGSYTAPYTEAFFEDIDTLRVLRAHHYPRATEHIPEMIDIIERLTQRGHTYVSDGSVYYRIASFERYGQLSGLERDKLIAGARVDADEYGKDDPADFVLWKASRSGEPAWDSPWGRGRPGWHIECSAMAMKYLGESLDIHTGGVDNKFPHHENEIAQSEAATHQPFVRLWMHCAHLMVEGQKMSKSLGNFYTLRDLLERGHEPRLIRYVLLGTHYRKPLNFTFQGLDQARAELERLGDLLERLDREAAPGEPTPEYVERVEQARREFGAALDDDLNISGAIGELFRLVRDVHTRMDTAGATRGDAAAVRELVEDLDGVVGALLPWEESAPEVEADILEMVEQRNTARKARNWAEADRLRDLITARGYLLEDTPQGVRVKRR
jgi:cysteinyl-tRNA synthetase